MNKIIFERPYNHPIKSIFSTKKFKSKGGNGTLASNRSASVSDTIEDFIGYQGLPSEETQWALADIRMGFTWKESAIFPKNDLHKKQAFESLRSEFHAQSISY